jgi:Flp pilus assembly protein TadG
LRRGLFRNEQGVAAIEFAFMAPIFFFLVFVLIDLSWYFVTCSIVDNAVENGARAVRLGQLDANPATGVPEFRSALCTNLVVLDCNNFSFSVSVPADLGNVVTVPEVNPDGTLANPDYNPGGPQSVVLITIVYVHHFLIPYVAQLFGDTTMLDPTERAIISYLVVKNEPFPN